MQEELTNIPNKLPEQLVRFIDASQTELNAKINGALTFFMMSEGLNPNHYEVNLETYTYKRKE